VSESPKLLKKAVLQRGVMALAYYEDKGGKPMAIEHTNGDFEIGDFFEMREKFFDMTDRGVPVRAFHVGNFDELQKKAEEKTLKERLEALEAKIKEVEIVRSDIIHLPTRGDMDKLGIAP